MKLFYFNAEYQVVPSLEALRKVSRATHLSAEMRMRGTGSTRLAPKMWVFWGPRVGLTNGDALSGNNNLVSRLDG